MALNEYFLFRSNGIYVVYQVKPSLIAKSIILLGLPGALPAEERFKLP